MPPRQGGKRKKVEFNESGNDVREIEPRPTKRGRKQREFDGNYEDEGDDHAAHIAALKAQDSDESEDDLEDSDVRKRIGADGDSDEEAPDGEFEFGDEDKHEDLDTEFTDGGYTMTPFNLEDEMEEGKFDTFGNYVEDKDAHAGDEWLEGVKVYQPPEKTEGEEEEKVDPDDARPTETLLEELCELLLPRETVTKAIQRLGGKKPSMGSRWAKKKQPAEDAKTKQPSAEDKVKFGRLTAIVDKLLSRGRFDVYQDTYEKLAHELKVFRQRAAEQRQRLLSANQEARMDETSDQPAAAAAAASAAPASDEATFEFKWEDKPDAEVYGPFTATQMLEWQDQNYFGPAGVMVRQLDKEGSAFYLSTRVDFDLYT
eukprot:m.126276 g.126276  ORF g.126276 m.126276 type:complete len:371 (-) comp16675_c0_seq1:354-1466(-)